MQMIQTAKIIGTGLATNRFNRNRCWNRCSICCTNHASFNAFSTTSYLFNPSENNNSTTENNTVKYLKNTNNPDHAGIEEKQLSKNLIDKFQDLKNNGLVTVDDVKHGRVIDKEIKDIRKHNERVIEGEPGQIIEVHGDNQTQSISARFENANGALAYEVVSTKTPEAVDREDFYDDQPLL